MSKPKTEKQAIEELVTELQKLREELASIKLQPWPIPMPYPVYQPWPPNYITWHPHIITGTNYTWSTTSGN